MEIEDAIRTAEKSTSGEIRVHIDSKSATNVLDSAAHMFQKLNMHKTELRNGVLFYMSIDDKKIAVIGDVGINSVVEPDYWDAIKGNLIDNFRKGEYVKGFVTAILACGTQLKEHFPYQEGDVNELPDEISFGR